MTRILKIPHLVVLFLAFIPMSASADDQDVIDYREHIMRTLDEQSSALGMILSGSISADSAVTHLQAIALAAKIALKAFEPKVVGGEAKPEVWADWTDFSKRMNEFAQKSGDLAKVAKEKGYSDALQARIVDALSCKSCHDLYRKEKK
jgi:cytochrome c556